MNRGRVIRIVVVSSAVAFSWGGACGPPAPPPPDSCDSPNKKGITTVELGPEAASDGTFDPWAAEDRAYITRGFQGGNMIVATLRMSSDAPECVQQKTVVKSGGTVIAQESSPLNTYPQTDGTRMTKQIFLIFDDDGPPIGSEVDVVTTAGGQTVSTHVTIATDRHKLESITVTPTTAQVGDDVTFVLKARLQPAEQGLAPMYTASNPDVVYSPAPSYLFQGSQTWQGSATAAGETDYTVKYNDQMVTTHLTVTP